MHQLNLVKFYSVDFDDYFSLVSNKQVMAMITERAISFEEAAVNFKKLVNRDKTFQHFGTYKVIDMNTKEFLGSGNIILNEKIMTKLKSAICCYHNIGEKNTEDL